MRVLVTGATGMLGRAVMRRLEADDATVAVLARGPDVALAGARNFDLGAAQWTEEAIADALASFDPDYILHLAGGPDADPIEGLYERNVFLTLRLLHAAQRAAPDAQVLVIGSAAEYGVPARAEGLSSEDDACWPETPYGIAKLSQTRHVLSLAKRGAHVAVARVFNPVGPGMARGLAFADFAARLATGNRILNVGDVDAERDFLSADEAARIMWALVREKRAMGKVVNVCSGIATPVRVGLERMIARFDRSVELAFDPRLGASAVRTSRGDTALLRALGIEPASPDIGAAIDALVDDVRSGGQHRASLRRDARVAAETSAIVWHALQAANWERAHAKAVADYEAALAADRELGAARIAELRRQVDLLGGRPFRGLSRQGTRVAFAIGHPLLATKLLARRGIGRISRRFPALGERLDHSARRLSRRLAGRPVPVAGQDPLHATAGSAERRDMPDVTAEPVYPPELPLVSIIIPCFNYGRFVAEALASVLAQTFARIEVIVVDGGSTDGTTREVVAALAGDRVRVFLREEPHRVGDNRNFGIAEARGKYVCCLDADDRLDPTYIEKAAFLLETFRFDVVSTSVQLFGDDSSRYSVADEVDLEVLIERNEMATAAVFRRSLWEAVGGYRDHGDGSAATHVHEDWEFWIRLAAAGARIKNITGEHLFHYRIHSTSSLSRQSGVMPIPQQRAMLRELTADVVTAEAIARSAAMRRSASVNPTARVNLAPASPIGRESLVLALPWMVLGGAERLLSGVANALVTAGWDLSIVTTIDPNPADGDTREWFASATQRIYQLPRFLAEEHWLPFLDYLVGSRGSRRLLIAGSKFAYEALPALKARYPDLRVTDLLFNTEGHTGSNRRYAQFIDHVIVENREVRDWLLAAGEAPERITLIESGVDLAAYATQGSDRSRYALGVGPEDVLVGFCGRWAREKNPLGFIDIAERLADNPRLHFVMTGAGQLEQEVLRRVGRSSRLGARFNLLGRIEHIPELLSELDILVVPSTTDGRPVVILEALASGVAVVASAVGGIPELIRDGENGVLCRPGDAGEFAAVVANLEADRALLARCKAGARAFAAANLDAAAMNRAYATTLAGPAAEAAPPAR